MQKKDMRKFNKFCGLSEKEVGIIKYHAKRKIDEYLPSFPDFIETILFLRSRDAWVYSWNLEEDISVSECNKSVKLKVTVKLKKEFHTYIDDKQYVFLCNAESQEDMYSPKIIIQKLA